MPVCTETLNHKQFREVAKMPITISHDRGNVVITTEDWDEFGDPRKTARYIDLDDAQRLHKELEQALFDCRQHIVEGVTQNGN